MYEGFGVDILNLIKDQAGRRTLTFIPTASAQDGWNEGDFSTFHPELLSFASDRYGTFNLGNLKTHSLEKSTRT